MGRIRRSRWLLCASTWRRLAFRWCCRTCPASATASATVRSATLPANLGFTGFALSQSGVSLTGTIETGGGIAGRLRSGAAHDRATWSRPDDISRLCRPRALGRAGRGVRVTEPGVVRPGPPRRTSSRRRGTTWAGPCHLPIRLREPSRLCLRRWVSLDLRGKRGRADRPSLESRSQRAAPKLRYGLPTSPGPSSSPMTTTGRRSPRRIVHSVPSPTLSSTTWPWARTPSFRH